jgi:predicted nucleic acid-binding protein
VIVVSDTSPIRSLGNLGLLSILQRLYGRVVIPRAVALELSQAPIGQSMIRLDDLGEIAGVEIANVADGAILERFLEELDRGESEALALAIELRADLVLIDESAGRSAAKKEGLEVIGVLGVLLEAKRQGLIGAVGPLLDELQIRYHFFIGEQLRRHVLRAAGE